MYMCVHIYMLYVCVCVLLTKKKVQLESCELSFIWSKMRTAALEAVLCRMSKSLSGKREGFQDNATSNKREVYC